MTEQQTRRLWLWYNKGATGKIPTIGKFPDTVNFTGGGGGGEPRLQQIRSSISEISFGI